MLRMDRMVTGWVHPAAAAFQLLTRLPIPVRVEYNELVFRRSVLFFPFVGLLLGVLIGAAGWLFSRILPPFPAGALLLGFWVYLTGGLHLDGLMDSADGLLSYRSRERMLEIMKDSRVGAMGVIACVLLVAVKLSLLVTLLESDFIPGMAAAAGAAIWGRYVMTAAIALWPYARSEGAGMGSVYGGVRPRHAGAAFIAAFLCSVAVLFCYGAGVGNAFVASAVGAVITMAVCWRLARGITAKIGGLTGDTYGALCEIMETVLLAAAVVWFRW